ncbi:MAG: DUF5993 family protein [Blastopirellula sp. JB062]
MDTIIFLLILITFVAMRGPRRWPVYCSFFASLIATFLLFQAHASDALQLNF